MNEKEVAVINRHFFMHIQKRTHIVKLHQLTLIVYTIKLLLDNKFRQPGKYGKGEGGCL